MNEEKFISIEYEIWQKKYLPMEKQLEGLKWQLEQEKIKKEAQIKFEFYDYCMFKQTYYIGGIDITVDMPALTTTQKERIVKSIMETLKHKTGKITLTREEAFEWNKTLCAEYDDILQVEKRIDRKLQNLPSIIKWLFKLKY